MTILVAVPDSAEGSHALSAAIAEARQIGTDLVVCNLGLRSLEPASVAADGVSITVVDRIGKGDRDPVDAVLDEVTDRGVTRLVIGIKRRNPVGKAILGSLSQSLILQSPVPVLAVKLDE